VDDIISGYDKRADSIHATQDNFVLVQPCYVVNWTFVTEESPTDTGVTFARSTEIGETPQIRESLPDF